MRTESHDDYSLSHGRIVSQPLPLRINDSYAGRPSLTVTLRKLMSEMGGEATVKQLQDRLEQMGINVTYHAVRGSLLRRPQDYRPVESPNNRRHVVFIARHS